MKRPLTVVQATALLRKHEYRPHSPKTISRRCGSKEVVDEFWFQDL